MTAQIGLLGALVAGQAMATEVEVLVENVRNDRGHVLVALLVMKDVVVLGAGPGGLAAGMLLANAGANVTVLERKPYVGGRSAAWRGRTYPAA